MKTLKPLSGEVVLGRKNEDWQIMKLFPLYFFKFIIRMCNILLVFFRGLLSLLLLQCVMSYTLSDSLEDMDL